MWKICYLIFLLAFSCLLTDAQELLLKDNWCIKSTLEVNADGRNISTLRFKPNNWYKTSIPSTVLNAFIKNNIYPDPRIGLNDYFIPDVSDSFNTEHGLAKYSYLKNGENPWKNPYWYRTVFTLPSNYDKKNIWITFKGINYRADIWVNGHLIADRNQVVGMFRRFNFNITPYVQAGKKNCLAVKVYQVDHPGIPSPGTQFKVFGDTRGHANDIFKDETMKMSGGWDCAPVVRDRNMGIYQDVVINATGDVAIENPYVVTTLPLHNISVADIQVKACVKNVSDKSISGVLTANISLLNDIVFPSYVKHIDGSMPPIAVSQKVVLAPGETKLITFYPKDYKSLSVRNPYLWYPNGYGEQYLHHLMLTFKTGGEVSDKKELDFGIREITTDLKRIGNDFGRVFYVNGKRIFCRGGWLQPDMLLENNRKRAFDEARLLANANINVVGSEDVPSPSDYVIESYDKYGLMYWEVFFQCWRMYPGTETAHYPLDHKLAVEEVKDIVKRYRNSPSVIAWFANNEVIVDSDLYCSTKNAVDSLDSTRPFIPTTSHDWNVDKLTPYIKADLPTGTTDDGAPDYNWNPPSYYFDKVEEVHLQMFRNELGVPSVPLYNSLCKFIPTVISKPLNDGGNPIYPLDSLWAEHGAWDGNNYCFRSYDNAMRILYGNPKSAQEYAQEAQFINADSYRAMFEAANHRMWDITTGVMIWKLNSCWPDVGWQIYDWYLNPNASYYFTKRALEPVHIQMNSNNAEVFVINTTNQVLNNVKVCAKIIDSNMNVRKILNDTLTISPDCYKESFSISKIDDITPVYFVYLELKDMSGKVISDNLYWRCSQHEDFSSLLSVPKIQLNQKVNIVDEGNEYKVDVELSNESDKLSFFNHLIICDSITHKEILPAFLSDNFITLFPHQKKNITVFVEKEDLNNHKFVVEIE
jgi:beta-galactosidase/beta-glucuronidase